MQGWYQCQVSAGACTCEEGLQGGEQRSAVDADALGRCLPEFGRQQQLARAACAAEYAPAQPAVVARARQRPAFKFELIQNPDI